MKSIPVEFKWFNKIAIILKSGFKWCAVFLFLLTGCKNENQNTNTNDSNQDSSIKHGLNHSKDATESPFDSMKPKDPEADQIALIEFLEVSHDFGTIKEGDIVKHTFKFQNAGKKNPLVITNVIADCGCTTPDWTREPITPGKFGQITLQFNSDGKKGRVNKSVTVEANTEKPRYILKFRADVIGK